MAAVQLVDRSADEETQRFHALVAAVISSQTKDAVTAAAMERLRGLPGGLTVRQLASPEVSAEALEKALHPVGFFRVKAKHLKAIAASLSQRGGRVPASAEELMKLPGVGPKVAFLVLTVAFDRGEDGMVVDTHVRRVCERLGWVPGGGSSELTREALQFWLPPSRWAATCLLLVGFGQQVCTPLHPKCSRCTVSDLCPSAFGAALGW